MKTGDLSNVRIIRRMPGRTLAEGRGKYGPIRRVGVRRAEPRQPRPKGRIPPFLAFAGKY
ncbi:MAG: hypothetical protein C6W56_01270 [Caldibacillus debilis]|nr:hypothetical protein [Bacillaceae bacterium]REJ30977.1 MAG: hypothetical protein C6W56_01270 [Caldibacillus debilis]